MRTLYDSGRMNISRVLITTAVYVIFSGGLYNTNAQYGQLPDWLKSKLTELGRNKEQYALILTGGTENCPKCTQQVINVTKQFKDEKRIFPCFIMIGARKYEADEALKGFRVGNFTGASAAMMREIPFQIFACPGWMLLNEYDSLIHHGKLESESDFRELILYMANVKGNPVLQEISSIVLTEDAGGMMVRPAFGNIVDGKLSVGYGNKCAFYDVHSGSPLWDCELPLGLFEAYYNATERSINSLDEIPSRLPSVVRAYLTYEGNKMLCFVDVPLIKTIQNKSPNSNTEVIQEVGREVYSRQQFVVIVNISDKRVILCEKISDNYKYYDGRYCTADLSSSDYSEGLITINSPVAMSGSRGEFVYDTSFAAATIDINTKIITPIIPIDSVYLKKQLYLNLLVCETAGIDGVVYGIQVYGNSICTVNTGKKTLLQSRFFSDPMDWITDPLPNEDPGSSLYKRTHDDYKGQLLDIFVLKDSTIGVLASQWDPIAYKSNRYIMLYRHPTLEFIGDVGMQLKSSDSRVVTFASDHDNNVFYMVRSQNESYLLDKYSLHYNR